MVRLPDATDQIRFAPLRALRAVFSGVGQLLLAADRLREEDARQEQESGDDQQDTHASWDGRLSSSVRLISPTGMPAPSSRGGSGRASGRSTRAGQPGRSAAVKKTPVKKSAVKKTAVKKTGSADSERADRADRATKPTARGGKNPADARRATANKAANAGGTRKSGRSRNAAEPSRFRSLDLTGNVRMLTDQDIADPAPGDFEPSTADAHAHESAEPTQEAPFGVQATETATPSWSDAAPSWSSWSASAPQTPPFSPAELPISGYDELSLPSLRARLRNLGAAELAELLAHERSHANRDDVITMFERRIAKLAEADD